MNKLLPRPIPEMLLFLSVAQPYHENYIVSGFQMTALGIPLNPYQGLKHIKTEFFQHLLSWNSPESLSGIETLKFWEIELMRWTWNSPESLSGIETFPAPPSLAGKGVGGLGFPNKKISA